MESTSWHKQEVGCNSLTEQYISLVWCQQIDHSLQSEKSSAKSQNYVEQTGGIAK